MSDPVFDVRGPLPTGVTVLEASAGTGKTFTIAALAARYVAEGTPLDRLLLVTFTRMATGELRERVRERLVAAEAALTRALAGALPGDADAVVRLLASGSPAQVEERRLRLERALADFDAATITTIHGFCQEVLGGLGIAGDVDRDGVFVEDLGDLAEEVVDDFFVRGFRAAPPPLTRAEALAAARAAIEQPTVALADVGGPADGAPALRRRIAVAAREEFERRKRARAVMSYDDLLTRLAAALRGPGGDEVAARLRERWDVVLVDEFQDTDPLQWEIVRRAFADTGAAVVLIGDPKQAIYAFRGADVHAYLDAAARAGERATLGTNWRSDAGLLRALDALFGDARLGHPEIVYRRTAAAADGGGPRWSGAPDPTPLRVRVVHRDDPGVVTTPKGYASAPAAREHIAEDLAADVVALLEAGTTLAGGERLHPGHVAVLVRTHGHATEVQDALGRAGVPAVIAGAGSVFATAAAREWLGLLQALERPASPARAHAAALTPFLGWSAARVAEATDEEWEAVHQRLHGWAGVLRDSGVAALAETVTLAEGLPARVLGAEDGERALTDLRHVGELVHAAAARDGLGVAALTAWLGRRVAAAGQEVESEERTRRLESDARAVQVLTIHRSKGLEFPVVYVPFAWQPSWIPDQHGPVDFHPDGSGERVLDVGVGGPGYLANRARWVAEQRGEDLRLLYVALTRAQHQAVVWWAGSFDAKRSPLGRLVFGRGSDGSVAEELAAVPEDAGAMDRFGALADAAPGSLGVERVVVPALRRWSGRAVVPGPLRAGRFDRDLDLRWRRTSYSDLTAGTYEARVGSEPEEAGEQDEEVPVLAPAAPAPGGGSAVPLAAAPAGVHVGTFVHAVLEGADFAAPDLAGELRAHVVASRAGRAVEVGDTEVLVDGLRAAIETPLGGLVGGLRLRDVARADRLDELTFELPLAGGDTPGAGPVTLAAIARVLRDRLAPDDPLAGYAERLGDPGLRGAVRGYLTGTIDLVVRLPDGRYAIADYKTNWLAGPGEELTTWHHRPEALRAEMEHAHYALQALLYVVALHRFLRWRVADYDPDRHLAGVLYLFVRGMVGERTPVVDGRPSGVFAWRPPAGLVEALSDVLDGPASGVPSATAPASLARDDPEPAPEPAAPPADDAPLALFDLPAEPRT